MWLVRLLSGDLNRLGSEVSCDDILVADVELAMRIVFVAVKMTMVW